MFCINHLGKSFDDAWLMPESTVNWMAEYMYRDTDTENLTDYQVDELKGLLHDHKKRADTGN